TQLELALVKAAAPDVDSSQRAVLTRVERLEAQLAPGGGEAPAVRAVPKPPRDGGGAATAAAAVAVVVETEEDQDFDLEALRSVWPAVLDAVREQNSMLAALLDGANPVALSRD